MAVFVSSAADRVAGRELSTAQPIADGQCRGHPDSNNAPVAGKLDGEEQTDEDSGSKYRTQAEHDGTG